MSYNLCRSGVVCGVCIVFIYIDTAVDIYSNSMLSFRLCKRENSSITLSNIHSVFIQSTSTR